MTTFEESLTKVLGAKTGKALATHLGLETVGDLMRHYPRRYAERAELTDLASLERDEHVTVLAEVEKVTVRPMRDPRKKLLEAVVTDGRGKLSLTFFNKPQWHESRLKPGTRGLFAGKVSEFVTRTTRKRQLNHPEYVLLDGSSDGETIAEFAGSLIPVYPAAAKVPSWQLARCARVVLDTLVAPEDPLPADLRRRHGLIDLADALRMIHRPRDRGEVARAKQRLKWDEAFLLQAALAQRRFAANALPARPRPLRDDGLLAEFGTRLPFELTEGQREVGAQIAADLARDHPMHRLLQGEVGSGKTVVALRAMLQTVDAGGQAALLAPTEVLAQQHHRSITAMLGDLAEGGMLGGSDKATRVALLTGSQSAAARREALLEIASGAAGIAVGTHALLEDKVQFADLGLVVIDEQHRFGVEQRDALREKAGDTRPHVLVMTATPIPRTVAMTVYGDLDTSALTQLPAGRSPIATHVVPAAEKPNYLTRAWDRVCEEVSRGRQAYIVCPRIGDAEGDEGDISDTDAGAGSDERRPPLAVMDVAPMLADGPFSGLRVGVLHGRLHPDEKDRVMRAFAAGEIDVLVATTVIEVGVDVPNSTVMIIMDADRFGVSQLHQLRGRVGRGRLPGLCLLVTDAMAGSPARERLDAVASTTDGFELSRIDLEQRREGDVLGAAQSGRRSSLRMLKLLRDEDVIEAARQEATALVAEDPSLESQPVLRAEIARLLDEERAEYLEKT
ncbi:ATP-dependent DNA helicase RecG [Bailinhaonella thermotolerans]|uniref:ATP-dependent DNA helicase RecG n=1 Tax=Bailinhaonella thermotolerans TaxID=1070861 RepID=A0A3A4AE99_9ACTN|nr:ATP-dependent DNA helicase RecG [Bailinhaonella thermotolerans]RJL25044.1 ATP-dependent DNA helicase RecG [Bailinhaonella thermotolerans]